MKEFGRTIGAALRGGEVLELIGDVGTGKTTLTKGLAEGLAISEPVQSPTFTISRVYAARDGLHLHHYDFYRLGEAGIMAEDVNEVMHDPAAVTVIEWSGAVSDVLPTDRLQISIQATDENERNVTVNAGGERSQALLEAVK
jgi:tRNA threonylcarbamoyladenosine biosynthesis protein TsaE